MDCGKNPRGGESAGTGAKARPVVEIRSDDSRVRINVSPRWKNSAPHHAARSRTYVPEAESPEWRRERAKKKTLRITQRLCGGLRSSWPDPGPGRLRTMYRRMPLGLWFCGSNRSIG